MSLFLELPSMPNKPLVELLCFLAALADLLLDYRAVVEKGKEHDSRGGAPLDLFPNALACRAIRPGCTPVLLLLPARVVMNPDYSWREE